jgi:hypothetical protein
VLFWRPYAIATIDLFSEKVYFTPQPMGVGTHHPQPMKMDFLPPELSKIEKSPLKQF